MPSLRKKVADYTGREPGTRVGEDAIQVCDKCGKPGLTMSQYQRTFFLHAIWLILNEDGSTEIEDEVHSKPSSAPGTPSPANIAG